VPTTVTAKSGDCLCGIAIDHGFIDCGPLRDLPENAKFRDREPNEGEEVLVPDLTVEDHSKAVDSKHTFKLKSSPPFNIRFVHGSPNLPYRDDSETTTLHVSNFVTNLGGATGLAALPTGFGFNDNGHQDPDTFKVEVWDPSAGGSVNVKLEAMKPGYQADPVTGKLTVKTFTPFTDAGRKIDALVCNQVSSTTANTYRSKYMRLVVDEEDLNNAGVTDQLLFTSDLADGLGTGAADDNDTVEILDQMVRATYEIQRCPGPTKCKVSKIVDIGGSNRQRVRLHFHCFRNAPGGADSHVGITTAVLQQHLRRRTFKWYRRAFAQADLTPKLVSMNVLDPPQENMLCLSHGHGRAAAAGARLSFRVTTDTKDEPFELVFTGGETPVTAGGMIAGAMPAGFTAESLQSTRATSAANHACDVLIKADNGERVILLDVQMSAGAQMTVDVPRLDFLNISAQDAAFDGSTAFQTIDFKRLLRDVPVTDDAMHCIVIGEFDRKGLRGIAFPDCHKADAPFRPALPFHSATIMAYRAGAVGGGMIGVLDNTDTQPFTSPHESAHTLCDLVHTKVGSNHDRNQLLGRGTSAANAVGATKRLCDGPFTVNMEQNLTTTFVHVDVKLVEVMRSHGAGKMEAW